MTRFSLDHDTLLIYTSADPAEVVQVKQLHGRSYDEQGGCWRVPIVPGLSKQIQAVYGYVELVGLVEEFEKIISATLQPPAPGTVNPWKIGVGEAVTRAINHHFFTAHGGDLDDYNRVHAPYKIGE